MLEVLMRVKYICLFVLIMLFPMSGCAAGLENSALINDPVKSLSIEVTVDMSGFEDLSNRMFSQENVDEETAAIAREQMDKLRETGFFDLKDMTFDVHFQDEWVTSKTSVEVANEIKNREIGEYIKAKPKVSDVRAMIPEEETLMWTTIMDPSTIAPLTVKVLDKFPMLMWYGNELPEEFGQIMDLMKEYGGDEFHLIVYEFNPNYMAYEGNGSFIDCVFICSLRKNIAQKDIDGIKGKFNEIMPPVSGNSVFMEINTDYFILATSESSLKKTTELVLTPGGKVKSESIPMNALQTINLDKLRDMIPGTFWDEMESDLNNPDTSKFIKIAKSEDLGSIRIIRTHTDKSILYEFRMKRIAFSVLYHFIREAYISLMGYNTGGMSPYSPSRSQSKDAELAANIHTLQIAAERYHVDNNNYPDDWTKIKERGYMGNLPDNPYTGEEMKDVNFPGTRGDFMYIPRPGEKGKTAGFWLLGFGDPANKYDKINNDALMKRGEVIEEPDGIQDDVRIVVSGGLN
jgi:hypothetical protein